MKRGNLSGILAAFLMAIIILDAKTVLSGAQNGIELCIQTIIPALFPFIILSGIINSSLLGQAFKTLRPIGRLCRIPKGAESILLLGFLGGYPVGAQAISRAYTDGYLSKNTAKRMLGFCNNAGPAFIFGMLSVVFSNPIIPWMLWAIHILSGLTVGILLPGGENASCEIKKSEPIPIPKALNNAIKTMSLICGWVIVFRIIIAVCDKWFLWIFPVEMQVAFSGFLELSNGCVMLKNIPSEATRFLYASAFLAFGGLCVGMQTSSVAGKLGCGYYFPGKLLQTLLSLLFSMILQPFIFEDVFRISNIPLFITLLSVIGISIYALHRKKLWQLGKKCCIIPVKTDRKEQVYAVSKENNTFLQLLPTRHRRR